MIQHLSGQTLRQEFEGGVIGRKSFCAALDIGESTLSTWLQAGRIPRVAALAYTLWLAVKKLSSEIEERDELATELYVIRCRDGYAVVQPPNPASPEAVGHVIASGVETAELAREIAVARSSRFRKVLDRAVKALSAYEEQFEDQGDDNWVAEIASDLERAGQFKVGAPTSEEL
jgi:hypothetical protein